MTLPSNRRARDLRLSVTYRIGDTLGISSPSQVDGGGLVGLTVPVYHDWPLADPDSMRLPAGTQEPAFVGTHWIQDGAGMRSYSILQVDVYTRVGPQGANNGDALGLLNADICDAVAEVFAGTDAADILKAYVHILNFDTDPPTEPPEGEGGCLVCQTLGGEFGVPMDRRSLGRRGGFVRTSLRFSFRTTVDAIRGVGTAYYTPRG